MKASTLLGFGLLIVLQATWLPQTRIDGVMPDAVLVVLSSWALLVGGVRVVPLAAGAGVLLDLIGGTPLGLSSAALLVAVFAVGWWRGAIFYNGILLHVAAAVVATLAYDAALLVALQSFHDPVNWPAALTAVVLPSAALNGMLALPVGYIGSELAQRLGYLDVTERMRTNGILGHAR